MSLKQTPLHEEHVTLGAKLVDFAGWSMPIHYGSQLSEHKAVRAEAGMFDVSHMRPVDVSGPEARAMLRHVLANDIAKIDTVGRAFYTCMLNTRGGVIDDLIVYHLTDDVYRIVLNAGTAAKDMAWLSSQAEDYDATVTARDDLAIIAVQGPQARELTAPVLSDALAEAALALKPFRATVDGDWSVGRTGYTGEDGFELILPTSDAVATWRALIKAGVEPIGLGARDTLRLEAGLNLYGQDMDEDVSPLEAGLGWTVAFEPTERAFIGRDSLTHQKEQGDLQKLIGIVLEGRGVLRHGTAVRRSGDDNAEAETAAGIVTSGSFAPTLEKSIGLARVPADWRGEIEVHLRGKWSPARIVKLPFVRQGQIKIDL